MEIVQKAWLSLAKNLEIPPNSVPYIEMRKAFFAGAHLTLAMLQMAGKSSDKDEESYVRMLENMWQECEAFRLEVTHDPNRN